VDQVGQILGQVGDGPAGQILGQVGDGPGSVATCLHEEEKPESVEKVGGYRSTWAADHVAWPVGHHLAPNRPLQVGGGPIHPYKYPLMVKVEIPQSTCSSPLVKV
jgi:hypothetical protein